MIDLVTKVIVQTFEEKVGKFQTKKGPSAQQALLLKFSIRVDHDKEEGYRQLEMLIYGPFNYVGVFTRETWNVIPLEDLEYNEAEDESFVKPGKDYQKGASEWLKVCYHDSGWRTDGVHRILFENRDKIQGFNGPSFYEVVDVPAEILAIWE